MSMILENLIRTYLIEGRTVAKIRSASAKDTVAARAAGAVYAYNVLVKGTSNSNEIIDLVQAATLASTGVDTENRVAVGQSSKFGNGNYFYVMSDPLPKKRQIIVVRIFKALPLSSGDEEVNTYTSSSHSFIGRSPLFTVTDYKQILTKEKLDTTPVADLKSKESEASDAIKQTTDVLAGNKEVTDYGLTRDGKDVGKFNGTIDKNGKPLEGKAVLMDGQIFDGTFKDGAFVSGTCRKIIANGDIFEGELTDGVPTANVTHNIIKPDGKYYEGTVNTDFLPVDGTVYTTSAKTEKVGDFVSKDWIGVEKPLFTNQQIIDATKSSKYSDATKYFQQLMVDKIATQPKIVAKLGNIYTKVKNNVDGKWGDNSKTLTIKMKQGFKLDPADGTVTAELINKINGLDKEAVISKENSNESIIRFKNSLLEQFDLDAVDDTSPKTTTPSPKTVTPTPKPKPTPTPILKQDIITKDQYVLKKDHVIDYVAGSADTFFKNMFKWLAGSYRTFGGSVKDIYNDSFKYKWFTRKTITIPKGTKVYIHPTHVVMIVDELKSALPRWSTPAGNTWRIVYNYKDKTLSTSSYYKLWVDLWKKYVSYPRYQDVADSLGIDDIKYTTPKYRNDKLIGFLRTLDPKVQSKQELVKNLTKKEKEQLNKQFNMCVQIAKDFYEIFDKNTENYFGKFKGSVFIPGDQDLKGALLYLQDAIKDAYVDDFKTLDKSTNKDIQDNVRKLHDVYVGVQEYLRDLIRSGNSRRNMLFKFKLIHPFDSKKNTNVTIRFDYL